MTARSPLSRTAAEWWYLKPRRNREKRSSSLLPPYRQPSTGHLANAARWLTSRAAAGRGVGARHFLVGAVPGMIRVCLSQNTWAS